MLPDMVKNGKVKASYVFLNGELSWWLRGQAL